MRLLKFYFNNFRFIFPAQKAEDLKQRLLEVWAALDQRIIDNAVAQWRQRLQACVQAEGGHFEHLL